MRRTVFGSEFPAAVSLPFESDARDDVIFGTVTMFWRSPALRVFSESVRPRAGIAESRELFCPSRCEKSKSMVGMCRSVRQFYESAMSARTRYAVLLSIITMPHGVNGLNGRCPSVPKKGRYCLKLFAESFGIDWPKGRPAAKARVRAQRAAMAKHAPSAPFGFPPEVGGGGGGVEVGGDLPRCLPTGR